MTPHMRHKILKYGTHPGNRLSEAMSNLEDTAEVGGWTREQRDALRLAALRMRRFIALA